MRLGLMVNDLKTEESGYTTTRLAVAALGCGHEAWVISAGDFAYGTDDRVYAQATMAPRKTYKGGKAYLAAIRGNAASHQPICVDELDVLLLRSDPSTEGGGRAWAQNAGILFDRAAAGAGVIVLNDPNGLANAMNKRLGQRDEQDVLPVVPEEVRPKTLITRNSRDIRHFVGECGGKAAIKPLQGSGGQGVFLIDQTNLANLNQMIVAVARGGFIIVQE